MDLRELTKKLWETYFTGDFEKDNSILSVLDPECVFFGTGKYEMSQSAEEFIDFIRQVRQNENYVRFHLDGFWCKELEICDDAVMVYGGVNIWWQMPGETLKIEMDSRFTCIYRKVNEGWKLIHVHQSLPNQEQPDQEPCDRTISTQMKQVQQRVKELKDLASRDSLTQLINLRTLQEIYDQRAQDGWIVIVDIDNFKDVNDSHGHLAGNAVLKKVAQILCGSVREEDAVARIGGDEFAILFGNMPKETLQKRLTAIQNSAEKEDKYMVGFSGISMGAVKIRTDETLDDAIGRADKAMYEVKKSGKNSYLIQ